MMDELKRLMAERDFALTVEPTLGGGTAWVMRSSRKGEDYYCAIGPENDCNGLSVDVLMDYYLRPAADAMQAARDACTEGGDEDLS